MMPAAGLAPSVPPNTRRAVPMPSSGLRWSSLAPGTRPRLRRASLLDAGRCSDAAARTDAHVRGWLDFWKQLLHHRPVAQPVPPRHRYTYAEYLAYEQDSGLKHEYDNGEILAMPGGSRRHNALASRVSAALEQGRGSDCVAFQSDQKVRILATGKATYPDATLVCGRIEGDPADPLGATITNCTRTCRIRRPALSSPRRGQVAGVRRRRMITRPHGQGMAGVSPCQSCGAASL
jgi:hypothetical protein